MAVEAQEICLLWGDWQIRTWWSCMNKSEWAGWVQAAAVAFALFFPFLNNKKNRFEQLKIALEYISQLDRVSGHIYWHVQFFSNSKNFKSNYDIERNITTLKNLDLSPDCVAAITRYDHYLMSKILVAISQTKNIVKTAVDVSTFEKPLDHEVNRAQTFNALDRNFKLIHRLVNELVELDYMIHPEKLFTASTLKSKVNQKLKLLLIWLKI